MKNLIFTVLFGMLTIVFYNAQKLTFTDENFKKAVLANYDLNKDGAIDQSEADKVLNLFISNKRQIRSATDINLFKNIQTVVLDGSILIGVDLKDLNYLNLFSCSGCNLLTFSAENMKSLTSLYLNDNKITKISLLNTPEINELILPSNSLSALDISQLKKLLILNIENNQITQLDVSGNPNLENLNFKNNPLQEEDIKRGKNSKKTTNKGSSSVPSGSSLPQMPN